MNKHIAALVAFTAIIFSGNSSAANLAFAFNVPLTVTDCINYPNCGSPPTNGVIYVELSIADPLLPDQTWGTPDVVSYAIGGFPSMVPWEAGFVDVALAGTYTLDAGNGVATAVLGSYSIQLFGSAPLESVTMVNNHGWEHNVDNADHLAPRISAAPDAPQAAFAQLQPVPLPAAAYLFITALVGLFGTNRVARKRQLSV